MARHWYDGDAPRPPAVLDSAAQPAPAAQPPPGRCRCACCGVWNAEAERLTCGCEPCPHPATAEDLLCDGCRDWRAAGTGSVHHQDPAQPAWLTGQLGDYRASRYQQLQKQAEEVYSTAEPRYVRLDTGPPAEIATGYASGGVANPCDYEAAIRGWLGLPGSAAAVDVPG